MLTLDDQQKEIVESEENNIIVVAGAGSGKTRVLTERIKYLLNKGVEPNNIVAITYTNMAAEEMKERLSDVENIGDVFIGTIHSFANKLMGSSGEIYQIFDSQKDIELHRQLISRFCKFITFERYLQYLDLRNDVEQGKIDEEVANSFLTPSEMTELNFIEAPDSINKEYPRTVNTLRIANKYITFNELLVKAGKYFQSIHAKIEYVLVDELQDISRDIYSFIRKLNADNYFFVGDDWQAIYGFNGGCLEIFIDLCHDKKFKKYSLTNNYRTAENIVKLAETVIHQCDAYIDKRVNCTNKKHGEIVIGAKASINHRLLKLKEMGDYKDWFILVRSNKDLFYIQGLLDSLEIPYSSFKKSEYSLNQMREEMNLNTVKLLTVHTSKGLENKNVILYGNFPLKYPSWMKNDEERRVMYVGMTRAMNKLWLLN